MQHRKIKVLKPLMGKGFTYQSGEEVELPEGVARSFVDAKLAEYTDKAEGVKPSAPPVKRSRKATRKPTEKR